MHSRKALGITLIELLLVASVIGMIMVMMVGFIQQKNEELRRNRTSMQMQTILNAAMSFYIGNGKWPLPAWQDSFAVDYLRPKPPPGWINPWGEIFGINNDTKYFYVCTDVKTQTNASIIAGTLPGGYVSSTGCGEPNTVPTAGTCVADKPCYAIGAVNIPGQNLNNATAVNFAGVYNPGACVPAPECPVDKDGNTMTPQIFVIPTSVSGENESGNYYPINSFTAYAMGQVSNNAQPESKDKVASCKDIDPIAARACLGSSQSAYDLDSKYNYWRVCLQISTEKGIVQMGSGNNDTWGKDVSVMAFTRCQSSKEYTGTAFGVYDQ